MSRRHTRAGSFNLAEPGEFRAAPEAAARGDAAGLRGLIGLAVEERPLKKFILDAFLKPLMATAFFVGFGGFFVFGGFQSVKVDLTKGVDGKVDGTVLRSHFSGLYTVRTHVSGVTEAILETRHTEPGPAGGFYRIGSTVSGVVITADSGRTSLFWGHSNVDETYKRAIVKDLNTFMKDDDVNRFTAVFTIRNVFGWVGFPFFLLGMVGVLGWPVTIVSSWRKAKNAAARAAA